jgi:hypothetical protein
VKGVSPRDRSICRIDATTGVQIVPEVGGRNSLKRLLPDRRNVRRINTATGIGVADEHAHLRADNIATRSG